MLLKCCASYRLMVAIMCGFGGLHMWCRNLSWQPVYQPPVIVMLISTTTPKASDVACPVWCHVHGASPPKRTQAHPSPPLSCTSPTGSVALLAWFQFGHACHHCHAVRSVQCTSPHTLLLCQSGARLACSHLSILLSSCCLPVWKRLLEAEPQNSTTCASCMCWYLCLCHVFALSCACLRMCAYCYGYGCAARIHPTHVYCQHVQLQQASSSSIFMHRHIKRKALPPMATRT